MPFRRGATLPVATSLGHAENCDLGPTAGNGFYSRWPDDLALLADVGITDLRITFDWARLQPKPGEVAGDWVERYGNVFDAAEAIGITVWATMYEAGVPKWFANEGGIDDEDALARWWPRWVERIADRFGDRVHGWIPFAVSPRSLPAPVWTDTWTILGGGAAPVASSDEASSLPPRIGEPDMVGVALHSDLPGDTAPSDDDVRRLGERWTDELGSTIGAASGAPVVVTRFAPHHDDPDVCGRLTERFVEITRGVDGVVAALFDPAIAGPDSPLGLFDSARTAQPAADAYLGAVDADGESD